MDPKYIYEKYENNAHFGTDFSNKRSGDSIYLGISGKVLYTDKEITDANGKSTREGNGNWMVVEYGYNFEGTFIGSGIFGEYMHMEKKPEFKKDTYLDSNQIIGTVGDTGRSFGAHLHYSIYTLNENSFSQSSLNMLLNDTTFNVVKSREAKSYTGTGIYKAKKVTYDIEKFLNGL
jgi:murein DD-endopeptidase MepM/ murein hydrolase activator NlpD